MRRSEDEPRSHRLASLATAASVTVVLAALPLRTPDPTLPVSLDRGPRGMDLALRRLGVSGRVLFVTAHPDDEDNAVLVALSRGRGLTVGLLTLTRGEAGQNVVGSEAGDALGLLREAELAEIHRIDGVRQFFSRALDFGYSVSLQETLERWGPEPVLGDVVRVVRSFRPDVMVTLPLDGPGHQHHAAAGRLAELAFRAAADPLRFPEQAADGLQPWQTLRLYQGGLGGARPPVGARGTAVVRTDLFDPVLGMTWATLGVLARGLHRSQGLEARVARRPMPARFGLVDSVDGGGLPDRDLLDGIDVSLSGLRRLTPSRLLPPDLASGLASLDEALQRARAAHRSPAPSRALPELRVAVERLRACANTVRASGLDETTRSALLDRLDEEASDLQQALVPRDLPTVTAPGEPVSSVEPRFDVPVATGFSVRLEPPIVVWPIATTSARELTVRIANRTSRAASARLTLEVPPGWVASPAIDVVLGPGEGADRRFVLTAPVARAAGGEVRAVALVEGREVRSGDDVIAHPHVDRRHFSRPASARLLAVDVHVDDHARVGYVATPGDPGPDALRGLGVAVAPLSPRELAEGDLTAYTTIVASVRAYESSADLRSAHARLMDWVRRGGRLVVQQAAGVGGPTRRFAPAPYPAGISAERVTDERAPVAVLDPGNDLFTTPNVLGPGDWDGWVEERGAHLLLPRDPRYVDLVASSDSFPENAGRKTGLLVEARVGDGRWIYVGLTLSRQLAAGVPGAYRLLANLVAVRRR